MVAKALAVLSACGVLAAALPAQAVEIFVFEFEGVVTELSLDNGLFGPPGSVSVGDPFSGHFAYEIGPGNADQLPGDPLVGRYDVHAFGIDGSAATIEPLAVGVQIDQPGPTLPPAPPDLGFDLFAILATSPQYPGPVGLRLEAPFGDAFSDDSLPMDLTLSDFTNARFVRGAEAPSLPLPPPAPPPVQEQDFGRITGLSFEGILIIDVPLPPAFTVFVVGLVAMGAACRSRGRPT